MKQVVMMVSIIAALSVSISSEAKAKARMSKSQAKKECLEDNPGLHGRELQKCIKQKRK